MTSFSQSLPEPKQFLRQNTVWILGLIPFVLAAVKVLTASGGDPQVFTSLLQNLDLTALVLSSVLPIIPLALFWVGVSYLDARLAIPKATRSESPSYVRLIFIAGIPAMVLYMTVTHALTSALLIALVINGRWFEKRAYRKRQLRLGADATPKHHPRPLNAWSWSLVVVLAIQAIVSPDSSWIPTEMIQSKVHGQIIGRVLSVNGDWTTILGRPPHIIIVPTPDVSSRELCSIDAFFLSRTVWSEIIVAILPSSKIKPTTKCPEN